MSRHTTYIKKLRCSSCKQLKTAEQELAKLQTEVENKTKKYHDAHTLLNAEKVKSQSMEKTLAEAMRKIAELSDALSEKSSENLRLKNDRCCNP